MFGDTRVPPDTLFNPADEVPPADAFDVQFRVPLSFSAYVTDLATSGRHHELGDVQGWYEDLVERTVARLQFVCGYVGQRGAPHSEARLAITHVVEPRVPEVEGLRPHAHVYVGATAPRLRDEQPGGVDERALRDGVFDAVFTDYLRRLDADTSQRFELRWGRAESGVDEVLDPPYARHVAGMLHGVCPGPWGPRRLVLADAEYLRLSTEGEARARAQRAAGVPGA